MNFVTISFLALTTLILLYILSVYTSKKRTSFGFEVFFVFVYLIVFIFTLFPSLHSDFEKLFNVPLINIITYFSVSGAYFLLFRVYQKIENQREEITSLTRKIAYIEHKNNNYSTPPEE